MAEKKSIRVVIVDDHKLVVDGLRQVLETTENCVVVGTAATASEALPLAENARPDVVLVDLKLPDGTGIELIRELRKRLRTTKVIVVTMSDDPIIVATAIEAGIHGYVVKSSGSRHLLRAISVACSGSLYLDDYARAAYEQWSSSPVTLTQLELDVLQLLSDGKKHHEIARSLNMSLPTVNRHIRSSTMKLGVTNTISAVSEARRRGLI